MAEKTVLLLTHKINKWFTKAFKGLKKTAGNPEGFVLFNGETNKNLPCSSVCMSKADIWNLSYPAIGEMLVSGLIHIPFFKYFKQQNTFDYCWIIEDNVQFTGHGEYLFEYFPFRRRFNQLFFMRVSWNSRNKKI